MKTCCNLLIFVAFGLVLAICHFENALWNLLNIRMTSSQLNPLSMVFGKVYDVQTKAKTVGTYVKIS